VKPKVECGVLMFLSFLQDLSATVPKSAIIKCMHDCCALLLEVLLEANEDLATLLAGKALSKKEYFYFTTADGYGKVHCQRV